MMGPDFFLGVVLFIAACWDIAQRRVPNPLVLVGLLLGLASATLHGGFAALGPALMGLGLAFALTYPQWMLKWMGGGDAKLFIVVGTFVGPAAFLDVLLFSTAANGALALLVGGVRAIGRVSGRALITDARLPMAVAILAGFVLARLYPVLAQV